MEEVSRRFKIISGFSGVGFFITFALLFLAVRTKDTTLLLSLCPASVVSMGFDSAALWVGIAGWIAIAAMNAFLYGLVGVAVSCMFRDSAAKPSVPRSLR